MADEGKKTVDVRLPIPADLFERATKKQVDIAQLLRVALENELKQPEAAPRRPELRDLRSQR
jgi:post-segregation antitoxin (ccd killing protein)